MLSDPRQPALRLGSLSKEIKLPTNFPRELLTFIADELPQWRDHPNRQPETSEPRLTAQLCAHLNSAARRTPGWDILQFRQEEPDETAHGRTVDLAAAPSDAILWVDGRRYIEFDTLLPIECKRLPTPPGTDRDHHEYVFSAKKSTGGIQRFKQGNHAAAHNLAAMIGYIQQDTSELWSVRVAEWIKNLIESASPGWSPKDIPSLKQNDVTRKVAVLSSTHSRAEPLEEIELRHLWVEMN